MTRAGRQAGRRRVKRGHNRQGGLSFDCQLGKGSCPPQGIARAACPRLHPPCCPLCFGSKSRSRRRPLEHSAPPRECSTPPCGSTKETPTAAFMCFPESAATAPLCLELPYAQQAGSRRASSAADLAAPLGPRWSILTSKYQVPLQAPCVARTCRVGKGRRHSKKISKVIR